MTALSGFPTRYRSKNIFWLLTGILIVSFSLKITCLCLDPVVSRDGSLYIRFSQIWFDTDSFQCVAEELQEQEREIPQLPLFLIKSLMHLVGLSAEVVGIWLNLVLGTLTPLFAYGIACEVTRRKDIALVSAFLIAVNPSMNTLAHEVQRDMIYLFFIGLLLWLIAAGIRRQKWKYWLLGGFTCGCAILTRFETLEFFGLVPLLLFLQCAGKYCSWKKGICYGGLFFLSLFGSIVFLSFLMQTQDHFLTGYVRFFQDQTRIITK